MIMHYSWGADLADDDVTGSIFGISVEQCQSETIVSRFSLQSHLLRCSHAHEHKYAYANSLLLRRAPTAAQLNILQFKMSKFRWNHWNIPKPIFEIFQAEKHSMKFTTLRTSSSLPTHFLRFLLAYTVYVTSVTV